MNLPLSCLVWAAQAETTAQKSPMGNMLFMIVLLGFFMWFIVLRPQKREKQEREKKLASIRKGDRVVTIGGMHGKVAEVDEGHDILTVEVAPKVAVKFNRSAIAVVDSKGGADSRADEKSAEAKSQDK